ncbi:acetate--CoA ligase family protein [Verminephrobacter eiseniae]|uniref:acetate--CoA ligase family protein n=1 Tax=Verminephrobacter eiseniae TaxID=364317 RepID=UPI002238874C|nr:acetate--CoA ligase family protein [Verminephrobacter eiseniae]MCW5235721.1 CoA-binding protein [Verminephrobacter eiseniae]
MLQLLTPRRVAVLGASENPVKAGGRPIAYMRRYGFQGDIYPVNPRRTEVQGLPCYASLDALPQAPDLVVISLAGSQVDAALAQCIAAGARCAVIYSSGFAELGAAGLAAQQALVRRASAAGLRLIGPNTQGVANFQTGAVLNFSTMINECAPQDGAIAIVSQSGAGAGILYGGLRRQGLGVRYMVATGNEADVNVASAVRGLLEDPSLRLILMYAEALRDTGLLAEAAALSARRDVPILAVKAARTQAGQATASSHTGALASEDVLAEAFLRQHNIVRVRDFDELVEYAQLFERRERPRGRKLVAISNSGATCVLAADAIEQNDMLSAEFTPSHAQALRAVLPAYVAVRNPIDMTTALLGQPGIYGDALRTVADSGAAHGVFVGFPVGGEGYDMSYFARQTMDFVAATGLPVAVGAVQDWVASAFRTCGLPVFGSEFRAIRGLALLARYEEGRAALRAGAESAGCAGAAAGLPVTGTAGGAAWDEPASLALLAQAGLPVVRHRVCRRQEDIAAALESLQRPVVLKGVSAAITHKSEHGLVRLGVSAPEQAHAAWRDYQTVLDGLNADFGGLLVAEQARGDFELAVGAHWDATFGPVVMVGHGGVLVEAYQDMQFLLAPFTRAQALAAIARLRVARGFAATRGLPAVDLQALAAMLVTLGQWFVQQQGAFSSIDANPVLVSRTAAPVLVDAVVIPCAGARAGRIRSHHTENEGNDP